MIAGLAFILVISFLGHVIRKEIRENRRQEQIWMEQRFKKGESN